MATGRSSNRDKLVTRQMTAPATGPAPDSSPPTGQVSLNTLSGADDLKAIEALSGTAGMLAKTAANTWALRTLTGDTEAVVTNGTGAAGNPTFSIGAGIARTSALGSYQPLDSDLTAIAALSTTSFGRALLALADAAALRGAFDWEDGTFTPTVAYATPGTSSISYSTQTGYFSRVGKRYWFEFTLIFTPTLGTGTGDLQITGLPNISNAVELVRFVAQIAQSVTWPTGTTQLVVSNVASAAYCLVHSVGTGAAQATWGATQFPNAAIRTIRAQGTYFTT